MNISGNAICTSIPNWIGFRFNRDRAIKRENQNYVYHGLVNTDSFRYSVIVIEKERRSRQRLRHFFYKRGYAVRTYSGIDAISLDRTQALERLSNVDLVVCSISDDECDAGIVRMIKMRNPNTRIIITTDSPNVREAIQTVRAGAFDYIQKPIKTRVLEMAVTQLFHPSQNGQKIWRDKKRKTSTHRATAMLRVLPGGLAAT